MSHAYADSAGRVVQLDGRAGTDINVTASDVQDAEKLARLLQGALRDIAALRRRRDPKVIYFRDVDVDATGTTKYPLAHRFGGRVNWAVVAWSESGGAGGVALEQHEDSDDNTLVLISYVAGKVTLRVEEAG